MRIVKIHVKNFRSLRDVSIDLERHTAFIGANGSGKSSLLHAIDLFFSSAPRISEADFFGRSMDEPIEIHLVFADLTEEEKNAFAGNIIEGKLTVARIFRGGGKDDGKYLKLVRSHSAFESIRATEGAAPRRAIYNDIRSSDEKYNDLPAVRNAGELEEALSNWEAANPEECDWILGGGFVGWKNVAQGLLTAETSVVLVPAVRDVAQDIADQRNSVISQLLQLVVQKEISKSKEVKEFESQTNDRVQALLSPEARPELDGLAGNLTKSLSAYYEGHAVDLQWRDPEPFRLPMPGADISVKEGEDVFPVDKTGHGLQRAVILTLLQHSAQAEVTRESADASQEDESSTSGSTPALSGLILLIEEPELYQHPIKQRVFARVLRDLAEGAIPGVAANTQVVFATHSPSFVSLERSEEIRLVRREVTDELKQTNIIGLDLDKTACDLQEIMEKAGSGRASWTGTSLKPRLHTIRNDEGEAFFSDIVVLVEGVSDLAALTAVGRSKGVRWDNLGVHILPVGGKSKICPIGIILRDLGIPIYLIWDQDKKDVDNGRLNRAYQRLSARPSDEIEDMPSGVFDTFACFKGDLESVMAEELGQEVYEACFHGVCSEMGVEPTADNRKNPDVAFSTLDRAYAAGSRSATLELIVDKLLAMKAADRRPVPSAAAQKPGR